MYLSSYDKINFLIKFLILTSVFFLIRIPLGEKYLLLLAWVSKYVLWVMGYHVTLVTDGSPFFLYHGAMIGMDDAHLSNFNITLSIAMILAASRTKPKRR
ncbi:MAG: hypothetical protein U9N07_06765 [Euryarchaeota archaeon]|nr:hypothetical protein [Euryarchaeota archaeon]